MAPCRGAGAPARVARPRHAAPRRRAAAVARGASSDERVAGESVGVALAGRALELAAAAARVGAEFARGGDCAAAPAAATEAAKLGAVWVKAAQTAATRADLLPEVYRKALGGLQQDAPPLEPGAVISELRAAGVAEKLEQLGVDVGAAFAAPPAAAASLGVVYRVELRDGAALAVKLQRPGAAACVRRDVALAVAALRLVGRTLRTSRDLGRIAEDAGDALLAELDYEQEAANQRSFAAAHAHVAGVEVPRVISELSGPTVLTTAWVDGVNPDRLCAQGRRMEALEAVRLGLECSIAQLLDTGVLHADPHPGNLLWRDDGTLVYLDFGLLASVERRHSRALLRCIACLALREWRTAADALADMGLLKACVDRGDVAVALERELGGVDGGLTFSAVLSALGKTAVKFRFELPQYYPLLARALASLEGIALEVDPSFRIVPAMMPYLLPRLLLEPGHGTTELLRPILTDPRDGGVRWSAWTAVAGEFAGDARGELQAHVDAASASGAEASTGATVATALTSSRGSALRRVLLQSNASTSLQRLLGDPSAAPFRAAFRAAIADWVASPGAARRASPQAGRSVRRRLLLLAAHFCSVPPALLARGVLALLRVGVSALAGLARRYLSPLGRPWLARP